MISFPPARLSVWPVAVAWTPSICARSQCAIGFSRSVTNAQRRRAATSTRCSHTLRLSRPALRVAASIALGSLGRQTFGLAFSPAFSIVPTFHRLFPLRGHTKNFRSNHRGSNFSNERSAIFALCRFSVRRTPRACHAVCLRSTTLEPRHLRSKRRSGHRRHLDNRRHFCGEFGHARRLLRHSSGSIRILLRASPLHSTSLASEFQFGETPTMALQRTAPQSLSLSRSASEHAFPITKPKTHDCTMKTNRTTICHYLAAIITICCGALPASSDDKPSSLFIGEWCNKDFNTPGVTRVHIRQEGSKLIAHMWGRCHPTECDWGDSATTIEEGGKLASITWNQGFKTETQKLKLLPDGTLELVGHSHYTDKSGRGHRDSKYTFAKGLTHDWSDPPKK